MPLREGAVWVYDLRVGGDVVGTERVVDEGWWELGDGRRVHQLRGERDGGEVFGWWSCEEGVVREFGGDVAMRGSVGEGVMLQWPDEGGGSGWRSGGVEGVEVPAGRFEALRLVRDAEGVGRKVWFARGVGIVRERVRGADGATRVRELREHVAGGGPNEEAVVRYLEKQLARASFPAFNNRPRVSWLRVPEAMLLRGRVAIARGPDWTRCFLVDGDEVVSFEPREADAMAAAAERALGATRPPEPLDRWARLLAQIEAERLQLGRPRFVAPELTPDRGSRLRGSEAHAELVGARLDGGEQRVAVWLTVGDASVPFVDVRVARER